MSISKFITYAKKGGPGWIQAAVTLGGGSLVGSLYLGVVGGYQFMWLQPLAMFCGIVMLTALSYVTLSKEPSGQRPFGLVKKHISPILAWGWLIATVVANVVFCSSQFALVADALQGNLGLTELNPFIISISIFGIVTFLIYLFSKEDSPWAKLVDGLIKVLVALIVLSFMGAVLFLIIQGGLDWTALLSGLIPDFSGLFNPSTAYLPYLPVEGTPSYSFWNDYIISNQRNIIIGAFGTVVGINMTFLLPYTLLRKKWSLAERELSRYDLVLGLMIPFLLASSCLIVTTASQFHANENGIVSELAYNEVLDKRLSYQNNEYYSLTEDKKIELRYRASIIDKKLSVMLAKRNANDLARSLQPFLGRWAQLIFGIGVLAMGLSTIIVHMMMNGYAVSEAFGFYGNQKIFVLGALIPAFLGVFSPIIWEGTIKSALVVPASVIATILLPIAYLTFLLLMNSSKVLRNELPQKRWTINILMILSILVASFASIWGLIGKIDSASLYDRFFGFFGLLGLPLLFVIGVYGFLRREKEEND